MLVEEVWKLAFTKCWFCMRPGTRSCPWDDSKGSIPTPGWTAIPTPLLIQGKGIVTSYHVIDCPLFVEDKRTAEPVKTKPTVMEDEELKAYLAKGFSDEKISGLVGLSVSTVRQRRQKMKRKERSGK